VPPPELLRSPNSHQLCFRKVVPTGVVIEPNRRADALAQYVPGASCTRRFDALYKRALVAANVTDFAARRRDSENRALLGLSTPVES